jgi:hypothetical protein
LDCERETGIKIEINWSKKQNIFSLKVSKFLPLKIGIQIRALEQSDVDGSRGKLKKTTLQ